MTGTDLQAEPTINSAGTATMPATSNVTSSVMMTMDEEEMGPEARQCVATLREGKRCTSAFLPFELLQPKAALSWG